MKNTILPILVAFGLIGSGSAQLVNTTATYASWNAPTDPYSGYESKDGYNFNYASGTTGQITFNDSSQIGITYLGEVVQGESHFQTSVNTWGPEYAFTSSTVSNLPNNGDQIGILGNGINTAKLSFSSPVSGLVMDIFSLGTWYGYQSETWTFDQPFTVLSQQSGGNNHPFSVYGNSLSGVEATGMIAFTGTFSSLSWTIYNPDLATFTVGTLQTTAVPEPSTYALFGIGALALIVAYRRKVA